MYNIDQLKKGVRNPELIVSELNRIINHTSRGSPFYQDGVDIFNEDWDNLIILDACRYDSFEQQSSLPGTTEWRNSRGTTSREFIRGNFTQQTLHDTVYISANPWFLRLQDEIEAEVHAYINLHSDEMRDAVGGLTTRPETVTEYAREAAEEHHDKRLIIHYLQPHQPFLGEFGLEIFDYHKDTLLSIKQSDVTHEDVWRAYRENLNLVLKQVEQLLPSLTGKAVITSDHGELLGERQRPIPIRHYGHPCGVYVEELLKVPWHVIEADERKEIVEDEPVSDLDEQKSSNDLDEQLSALGYKT